MAFDKKPTEKSASIASPEDALEKEGALGRIDREAFDEHLNDPDVRDNLEIARDKWKRLYGRDPASSARGRA